jgi:hypothetical protein
MAVFSELAKLGTQSLAPPQWFFGSISEEAL